MFKNCVEAATGIMIMQDVVQGAAAQQDKKFMGEDK